MKPVFQTILLSCLLASSSTAQETRIKGLVIPLFDHSIATEYVFHRNLSVQMSYQNQIELGDNIYYHHRLTPSVRYYVTTERPLLDGIYGEFFHRSARIRHIPDQSDDRLKKYQSQSIGLALGKQVFFRSRNMFMEFSFGRYLIYKGNVDIDRPAFDMFIHGNASRTRLDFKLGFRLRSKPHVIGKHQHD
jgi:hypothetical protein